MHRRACGINSFRAVPYLGCYQKCNWEEFNSFWADP